MRLTCVLGPVGTWERGKMVGGAVGLRLYRLASEGCWSSLRGLLACPGRFRLRIGLDEDEGATNGGRRPLPGLLIVQAPEWPVEGWARLQSLRYVCCTKLQLEQSASLTAMRARETNANATFFQPRFHLPSTAHRAWQALSRDTDKESIDAPNMVSPIVSA